MSEAKEYRLVKRFGRTFVEIRYKGGEWRGWLFATSETPKARWIYVPEVGLWRSNVSYG